MGLSPTASQQAYCQELFRFHQWRQKKIADLLREVDANFFSKQLNGSFGSLYIILKHMVWAEKVWLGRIDQNEVASMQDMDVPGLLTEWERVTEKWVQQIENTSQDAFNAPIRYFNTTGEPFENSLFEIVVHLIDHATYHAGQMMNAIRAFGIDPVSTNYIHYLRAKA